MNGPARPARSRDELLRDRQRGMEAWQRHLEHELDRHRQHTGDEAAVAGLERTRAAMQACLARHDHVSVHGDGRTRVVVALQERPARARVINGFTDLGAQVVGEAEDGAVAVALAVVEQPDLLLLEDRLAWVPAGQVVRETRRFAPRTLVAVQMESSADAAQMLDAGAAAVFSRGVPPDELCSCCVGALATHAEGLVEKD